MKKILFLLLAATYLFTACKKEDDFNPQVIDQSKYSIEGTVIDADGNKPMAGVTVSGSFGSVETDAKGYFNVGGLNHGSYALTFTEAKYGTMFQTFNLTPAGQDPLAVNYTQSTLVTMYQMKETLETTFWKSINNKNVVLANVPFAVTLQSAGGATFLNNKIVGVTDANGKIALLDTLPNASVKLEIEYLDAAEGKVYKYSDLINPRAEAKSYFITGTSIADKLYVVNSNIFNAKGMEVIDFAVATSLTFDFTQNLETDTKVTFKNTTDNKVVAFNKSVSGKTLTIDPIGDLISGNSYEVMFEVKSGDQALTKTYTFSTIGGVTSIGQVVGLSRKTKDAAGATIEVYENTAGISIEFTRPDGATQFEVYGKYANQTEYQFMTTLTAGTNPDDKKEVHAISLFNSIPNMNTTSAKMFSDGKTFTVIVRAKRGDLIGAYSEPLTIKKTADLP